MEILNHLIETLRPVFLKIFWEAGINYEKAVFLAVFGLALVCVLQIRKKMILRRINRKRPFVANVDVSENWRGS